MNDRSLVDDIVELYRRTATELPQDVASALKRALKREKSRTARKILSGIIENISMAKKRSRPMCQDTGVPIFYVRHTQAHSQARLASVIEKATEIATGDVPLRANAIDCLTDNNTGGNRPVIHFERPQESGQTRPDNLRIDLMLKGGGSENVSAVYQLPDGSINAERDPDGIRRCVLDAVFRAQGRGCPPYIVGVAAGGSIEEVAHASKRQLLRRLDDINPVPDLRDLEERLLDEINRLGIGPMGLGGKTTALAVKASCGYRIAPSYFVGVSFGCWCLRRHSL